MNRSAAAIAVSAIVLIAAGPSHTTGGDEPRVTVAANGHTHLSAMSGRIAVELVTRIQPIAEIADVTACTGSRTLCSLVSGLKIRVGKTDIEVPRSAILRLADVNSAGVRRLSADRFDLVLVCGDASEAYDAHVLFDNKRVTQLDIIDGEAGVMAERTTYADLSHAFEN